MKELQEAIIEQLEELNQPIPDVLLLSIPGCSFCKAAKIELKFNKINYYELDALEYIGVSDLAEQVLGTPYYPMLFIMKDNQFTAIISEIDQPTKQTGVILIDTYQSIFKQIETLL